MTNFKPSFTCPNCQKKIRRIGKHLHQVHKLRPTKYRRAVRKALPTRAS